MTGQEICPYKLQGLGAQALESEKPSHVIPSGSPHCAFPSLCLL